MATVTLDPNFPIGPQIEAANDGDTIIIPPGVTFETKHLTFQAANQVVQTVPTLKVFVNGEEKAVELASVGDTIEVKVV